MDIYRLVITFCRNVWGGITCSNTFCFKTIFSTPVLHPYLFSLLNVLSKKCPIHEMSHLWNVRSIKMSHLSMDVSIEMTHFWTTLSNALMSGMTLKFYMKFNFWYFTVFYTCEIFNEIFCNFPVDLTSTL